MFEALFGAGMPLAVRFFLAFLIVLGLIGGTAWAVRRFGTGRLGASSARGRQPRLAVIDYATVDTRRRLILVRRDNIEHLLMIGGPTDVVVESNIVRAAAAATRDVPIARSPLPEALPRAMPLPEHGAWPLQPEPAAPPPRAAPRFEPLPEEEAELAPFDYHPEPPPRAPRETLAALAEEIAARPVPPRGRTSARAQTMEPRPMEPRLEARGEPRLPHAQADEADAADQSLAEMAHRLEAALRKPKPATEARAPQVRPAAPPEPAMEEFEEALPPPPPPPAPRLPRGAEARPPRAEVKAHEPPKSFEPRPAEPKTAEARHAEARHAEARHAEARHAETRHAEPRHAEPRHAEPRPAEPRPAEPRPADVRYAEARTAEAREAKTPETKTAEPKPADGRGGQGKGLYDSLEQEMASLLGRPAGKT